MKLLILVVAFFSCAAHSQVRHDPCSVDKVNGKIIFDCGSTQEEVSLADLKGDKGKDGKDGKDGMDGENSQEQFVNVCVHDNDHIDKTYSISVSELIKGRWGMTGQYDYAGNCDAENQCSCDRCPRFVSPSNKLRIRHNHGE